MPVRFAWDERKAATNIDKHGIDFGSAVQVFSDPKHVVFDVSRAEDREERRKAIGAIESKLYCVVHTMRGDVCWIISARRTNPKEDRAYADLHP